MSCSASRGERLTKVENMSKHLRRVFALMILVILSMQIALCMRLATAAPITTPPFSLINPGPSSNPSKWNASSIVRDLGTTNFKFLSNETAVGSTFFANATVTDVTAMYGWGIGIVYDNTVLKFLSASLPTDHVFKGAADIGDTIIKPAATDEAFDATHHKMKFGATYIQDETNIWSFNGTGTMCQVQFKIIQEVNETFTLASTALQLSPDWTTVYYWPSGQETPVLNDGNFVYSFPVTPPPSTVAALAIDPASIVDASKIPPSTFDVNVTIKNATKLNKWSMNIYYNNTLLSIGSALEGDFMKSVGTTSFASNTVQDFNATHGRLELSCQFTTASVGASGDGVLVAITFQISANGSTLIAMDDIQMTDSFGNPHSFTKANGFFSNIPTLPGDINGDHIVNMDDVIAFVNAFGSFSKNGKTHPRWNAAADINGDGIVDVADLVVVLMNFGKTM